MPDDREINYEVIPDARNHHNRPKPMKEEKTQEYKVAGSDFFSVEARDHELAEFRMMQDRNLFSGYLEWGEHEVRYTDADDGESVKKLQSRNDAYTMNMLMSCIGPLRQGISPGSLLQVWLSYQVISTFNENMDVDVSRMCSNMRQDLERMRSAFEARGPLAKFAFNRVSGFLDGYLNAAAGSKMSKSVGEAMAHDTLDELVMTPKQLAALKVSFMEQYYVDLRSGEHTDAYLTRRYNRAIGHISAIARNSGFDMSVVAAEERHIVGLKIAANAEYANVFNETCGTYGAKPCLTEDGRWSDNFVTADDHQYTVGGNAANGAFTVRMPAAGDDVENPGKAVTYEALIEDARRSANEFAGMMLWVNSKECPMDAKDRKYVIGELEKLKQAHIDGMCSMMEDDGLGEHARDIRERFEAHYESSYGLGMESQYGESIGSEVKHIIDKEVMTRMGMAPDGDVLARVANRDKALLDRPEFLELKRLDEEAAREHGGSSDRNALEIVEDARLNFLEGMAPSEIVRLMLHAGANVRQGMLERGTVFRDGYNPSHRGPDSAMFIEDPPVEAPKEPDDPEAVREDDEYECPV